MENRTEPDNHVLPACFKNFHVRLQLLSPELIRTLSALLHHSVDARIYPASV